MLARAVFRPQGLAFQGYDIGLDSALRQVGLNRLGNLRERRIGQGMNRQFKAVSRPR